jgi:metallo-beta-lactamase family protein
MDTLSLASVPRPTVTFWGAAQAVTGSMHLVEVGGRKVLLDCGSFRGNREEARRRNGKFPFPPSDIHAVVLSHAHIDHCGNLPHLVRQGFSGPIYCTPPTRDLLTVMLADSARIQEEDAALLRVIGSTDDDGVSAGLYTKADARRTVAQCVVVPYDQPTLILPDVQLRLVDAGHILGSALVSLTLAATGGDRTLTFTGDIGRRGLPFLREPSPLPPADVVISECTYGGRFHDTLEQMAAKMEAVVRRSVEQGGKVLIPAFSLGRTQVVVHYLHEWMRMGRLPNVPIFVDGRLAAEVADIYRQHPECFDPSMVRPLAEDPEFLGGPEVQHVRTLEESKELSLRRGPCIIVAASGMCEGGRILQHLKQNLDDPRCSVVLVSYQAPQTLGRKLLEPRPKVRIHGREWNLWAEVAEINGFSGHADHADLLASLVPLAGRTQRLRLVHGEQEPAELLAADLRARGFADVIAPAPGEMVGLP